MYVIYGKILAHIHDHVQQFYGNCQTLTSTDSEIILWKDIENDHDSSLLRPSSNLEPLVNQFNNAIPENSNDSEKISSYKYYDIHEMQNIEIPHKNKLLSLFHINRCSRNKNFDDLQYLLACTKKKLT